VSGGRKTSLGEHRVTRAVFEGVQKISFSRSIPASKLAHFQRKWSRDPGRDVLRARGPHLAEGSDGGAGYIKSRIFRGPGTREKVSSRRINLEGNTKKKKKKSRIFDVKN
jgi:hypothetical protein